MTPGFCGKIRGFWLLAGLCLLLGACAAPGYRAEVTRTHTLGPPGGETIFIEPAEGLEKGLEFERYAYQLAQYFSDYGYLPAGDKPPMMIARLGYEAKPDPNFQGSHGPVVGIGFGGSTGHVGAGIGTSIDTGQNDGLYYRHTVTLVLEEAGSGKHLFEGEASGYEYGEYWPGMMPRLLRALFTEWPGVSGTTENIKLQDK